MLGLGLLLATGQPAHAVQAVWDNTFTPSGWTRGSTVDTHYAEWNIFNDDIAGGNIQDTSPEVSIFGGGAYTVAELTGAAFLTSGGNIYSPVAPTAFEFTVGNVASGTYDVFLRIASLGNFDTTLNRSFTNFQLNGLSGVYSEMFNTAVGGGQGNEVEALVTWLGVSNASPFVLSWNAVGSSVSLDQLSLDVGPVAPVPLPAAAYLMASGIAGIAALARRRQRAA
jgi:hypothetical protein